MNRIVHFEIYAEDPERAVNFYKAVFGWNFEKVPGYEPDYWMVMTAEKDSTEMGINGGLLKRMGELKGEQHPNAFVCTILVSDIDEVAKKILELGGIEAMPKYKIMDMAWQAYYKDLEGNIFGIHQPLKKAE